MHKGAGGKGDRGGGGSGAGGATGGGASASGGGPGGYGYSGGKGNASEKGGSANAKGSDFASRPQQRAMAQAAMQDALSMMGNALPFQSKVITGMNDITSDKRSNSKRGAKQISPGKLPAGAGNPTVSKLSNGGSNHNVGRSNSPAKDGTDSAKANRNNSPKASPVLGPNGRPASNSAARNGPQPYSSENYQSGGAMNSLLKSPIKNNLQQVPIRPGGSGKQQNSAAMKGSSTSVKGVGAIMGDHTNTMHVTPSAFV